MRGGSRHGSQVVNGLDYFFVDLDVGTADGEALCARPLHADAHDCGDASTRFGAMDCDMDGKFEAHVKVQCSTGSHKLEYLLPVLDIKPPILAVCMRKIQQVDCVTGIERAVGNLIDKVGQLEVHLVFVLQGKRVALAAQLDGEESVRFAPFNFQAKSQYFTL